MYSQFKEGGRSIRSNQVHTLTNLFPGYVFPDIPASDFADRKKRPHIPEVAKELHDYRFLYDHDPKSPSDRLNGHLRNPCILKVIIRCNCFCTWSADTCTSLDFAMCFAWSCRCQERVQKCESMQGQCHDLGLHHRHYCNACVCSYSGQ